MSMSVSGTSGLTFPDNSLMSTANQACKAWVWITGGTSPVAYANASFNVSSITYNSAGDYQVNFTTAMSFSNYAALANDNTNAGRSGIYTRPNNASSCRIVINGGFNDDISFAVFSG